MRVAVIGAGIHGVSTARFLAQRGHDVTIFEQFPVGHTKGSSHGKSRIIRKAYPDAFYTEIMQDGYPMWFELQQLLPEPLIFECGLAYFGREDSKDVCAMIDGLTALSVPFVTLSAGEQDRVFRNLRLDTGEVLVFTKDAGYVIADEAVQWSLKIAQSHGAQLRQERAPSREVLEKDFDRVVVCAGSWIHEWADVDVRPTVQTFGYVEINQPGPVWIEDGGDYMYGFPTEHNGRGIKIGVHAQGREHTDQTTQASPDPEVLRKVADLAERRFGVKNATVDRVQTCIYTNTPNEDFRFGAISEKTIYASVCSGHGFKFGPWVGKFLTDVIEDKRSINEFPRFSK
ncbi:MAG: FAD-dependent oxidoreductase [Fimbriimonadaceae bacterium]|nr:FAD-dependent oxidoreductase [Fimbriimonadaceae bacterium]